jgi:hypothetical protein
MNRKNCWNFPSVFTTLALAAVAGCSVEVLVPGTTSSVSGGTGGSSSSSGGTGGCAVEPAPGLPEVVLVNPTSGVFLGGALHLSVSIGDEPEHYVVLKIDGGTGYLVNQANELDGPANLAPVDAQTSARVSHAGGSLVVETIDVSNPWKPFKTSSLPLAGTVPAGFWKVFSVVDNHLFTCLTIPPATKAVLVDVPLDGSGPPATPAHENNWDQVCNGFDGAHDAGAARGPVWFTWGYESDLKIFDVSSKGQKRMSEYNYNPDGIHAYGSVLWAATDGERIVFDPESNSEVFLYTVGSSLDSTTHAQFVLPGPKRLLGVVGKVAYWATATGVRAYDVANIDAPKLLDFHADAAVGEGLATLIAADAAHLAVADADGRLFVIPLGSSGVVEPLKTYLGEPKSGSAGACGDAP